MTTRTIRYYEELGLLAPAARSEGDYRLYDESDLERIKFIRSLRDDAGFSLAQIGQLIEDDAARARNRERLRQTTDPAERRVFLLEAEERAASQVALLTEKAARLASMVADAEARLGRIRTPDRGARRGRAGPIGRLAVRLGRRRRGRRRSHRDTEADRMNAQERSSHAIAGETNDNYRWVVLAVTSLGALLASLTSGTLVIALPDILRDLHTDLFTLLWIVVGYTLVATVLVLNAGRIADQVGRARTYTGGFALFTAASIACALAPTAFLLVIARLVQGVGGAFLMANSAALVTDAFPRRELGRALGINAMVVGAGLILGPILGGFLTSFGWPTVFWFNVPIGVLGTIAAAMLLVEQGQRSGRTGLDLARQLPVPRRPERSRDCARVRWHLRLDDAVGPRRFRGVRHRGAGLPVGRVAPSVAAARSWPLPQPPVRDSAT